MKKHTFYIGLNDKDTKRQIISNITAEHIVLNILGVDGTVTDSRGVYTHQDGTITTENTLVVELLDFEGVMTREWVLDKANAIKVALNQESVAYQVEDIKSELL